MNMAWTWAMVALFCSAAVAQDKSGEGNPEKAQQEKNDKKDQQEVIITGKPEEYRVQSGTSATRTDTPLSETPASIQVIPRQVFQDQAAVELKDALRNVSGFRPEKTQGFALNFETAFIRGFANGRMYYNGFPTDGIGAMDLSSIESIEVLKGPASILYGVIDPGGMINVVTKKPEATAYTTVSGQAGSYGYYGGALDTTGPIPSETDVLYRVNTSYTSTDSFRRFVEGDRYGVSPSVTWKLSPDTQLTADFTYFQRQLVIDDGVAFDSAGRRGAPINTFLGEPGFPGHQIRDIITMYRLDHHFSTDVEFRSGFLLHDFLNDVEGVRRFNPTTAANTVARFYEGGDFRARSYQSINDVVVKASLGPTRHKFLFGLDFAFSDTESNIRRGNVAAASITNPVYGVPKPPLTTRQDVALRREWAGLYIQDQVAMLPNDDLHLLLGGRFDYVTSSSLNSTAAQPRTRSLDRSLSGRAGVLYEPVEFAGVYASISQSFVPSATAQLTAGGNHLNPEEGTQYEAGLKFELLEHTLSSTLAFYEITKDNVAIADTANPGFFVNGGKFRSKGFEFDTAGRIIEGLDIILSYAYTGTEVVNSVVIPKGRHFRNIPRQSGSAWVKYTIQEGALKNLGFGAGIFASSDIFGDDLNTFRLPAYKMLDLALYYKHDFAGSLLTAGFNVENLLNQEYYDSSFNTGRVNPGRPFSVLFSVGLTF